MLTCLLFNCQNLELRNLSAISSTEHRTLNKLNFPVAYNMKEFKAAVNLYLKDCALGTEAQTVTMS